MQIHRRCFYDDHYGVDEPLNEPGKDGRGLIISGSHFVKVGTISASFRRKANEIYNEPILAFSTFNGDLSQQDLGNVSF